MANSAVAIGTSSFGRIIDGGGAVQLLTGTFDGGDATPTITAENTFDGGGAVSTIRFFVVTS